MAKYRKKPVEIEAFKFYVDNMPDWFIDKVSDNTVTLCNCDYKRYSIDEAYCLIETLEGVHRCNGGDYVIKGVKGELYPCKPDIFEMTYEAVETIAVEERKECGSENNKKLNKIIIKYYGEEIVINTESTLEEVAKAICYYKEDGSSLIGIKDYLYGNTIFLNPRAVTLIKDVTDYESIIPFENNEWCNKLATEVIKRINKHHKNQGIILKL